MSNCPAVLGAPAMPLLFVPQRPLVKLRPKARTPGAGCWMRAITMSNGQGTKGGEL